MFTVVKSTMPSYQKLQCRLTAPNILVACNGGSPRKKINTDDHLSMCSCSGGTALDKAVKFRISWSAWCTFSRGEQIRGYVPRENEHRGAHFRGWYTNSLANLCAGARLRGGNEYAVTPACSVVFTMKAARVTLSKCTARIVKTNLSCRCSPCALQVLQLKWLQSS